MVKELQQERTNRINAILSNGGYFQSEDGPKARDEEIRTINDHFDEIVETILNPEPEVDLSDNQFMQAGNRALDKLRWEMGLNQPVAEG